MKLTSSGIHCHDISKTYVVPWGSVGEFLIERNAVELWRNRPSIEVSFYVVMKDNKNKVSIDRGFGYDALGLAKLMAAKMCQSLGLSLNHGLVVVVEKVYGEPVARYRLDEIEES